ncbi:hypothetical protein U1Q18_046338 [Sarracenia purpurea var. burkii]
MRNTLKMGKFFMRQPASYRQLFHHKPLLPSASALLFIVLLWFSVPQCSFWGEKVLVVLCFAETQMTRFPFESARSSFIRLWFPLSDPRRLEDGSIAKSFVGGNSCLLSILECLGKFLGLSES